MIPWLILGITLLVGFVLVARWWVQAEPQQLWKAIRWTALALGVVLIVVVALSGRWSLLTALVFPAIPWIMRWRTLSAMRRNARGPRAGQASEIKTRFLHMTLDHDSGEILGKVIDGRYAGRTLADLAIGEAIEVWRECAAADEQSRVVMESYLDREHPEWRSVAGAGPREEAGAGRAERPWGKGAMSVEEARQILGVAPDASPDDIESAYRRAMKTAHPDHGGSDWMAAKVNQAKDVLLGD